jgi:hypothetical protein
LGVWTKMEERIQHKVEDLKMKTSFFRPRTYESLREEAMRTIEEEIAKEDPKKRMQHQEEQWKEAQEKQQEKKEEEREQLKVIQEREDPDKPLTLKDLRAIPGFYYNDYKRALEELNVEILKPMHINLM